MFCNELPSNLVESRNGMNNKNDIRYRSMNEDFVLYDRIIRPLEVHNIFAHFFMNGFLFYQIQHIYM